METKVRATDDGNSSCNTSPSSFRYSLLPDQALNVGTLSNFRQRRDISVGGSFDMTTEALVAREFEKRKIKEEILTRGYYGYLKRRELEDEVIRELIVDTEMAMRQAEGVSLVNSPLLSLQSGRRGLISNRRDAAALHERLALLNRLDGGGSNTAISLAIRVEGAMDGVLPLGNHLDDSVDARLSMINHPDGRISDGLPFQRQPGATSGVASKPVIDLRKAVPLAKPATSNALAGSKRKLETPTVDCDDGAASAGKGKKSHRGWSCELCQVKATSEQGMKDHLIGKKHKAKEKAMQITTKSVSNRSYGSDSPSEETEKSTELTIPTATTSPNPSNIVGGNQDQRNVEALSPKQQHADTNGGSGLEEQQKTEKVKNNYTDFKFWCNMCEVGTTSEASLTIHRMGKKHMSLLKEKGGGVIAIKTMPDDVQYVGSSRIVTANKEKEVSLGYGGGVGADEQETSARCTMEAL